MLALPSNHSLDVLMAPAYLLFSTYLLIFNKSGGYHHRVIHVTARRLEKIRGERRLANLEIGDVADNHETVPQTHEAHGPEATLMEGVKGRAVFLLSL